MFRYLLQILQLKFRGYIIVDNFFPENIAKNLRIVALGEYCADSNHYNGYKISNFDNEYSSFKFDSKYIRFFKNKIPILRSLRYKRSWSFVYNEVCRGVLPHADPSAYNINVWVTPDHCVYDKKKNGLIIFNKKAHPEWNHWRYNADNDFIAGYLSDSKFVIIPYKFNRAIIFPGKTFHSTAEVHMKPGHENRRINYTFLFE